MVQLHDVNASNSSFVGPRMRKHAERWLPAQESRRGCVDRWWIYFGTIAPRKIEFAPDLPPGRLTIRLALPGAEFQAETHNDPESRSRFAEWARQMRTADDPDAVIDIRIVEGPLQPADVVAPCQGTAIAGRAQPRTGPRIKLPICDRPRRRRAGRTASAPQVLKASWRKLRIAYR